MQRRMTLCVCNHKSYLGQGRAGVEKEGGEVQEKRVAKSCQLKESRKLRRKCVWVGEVVEEMGEGTAK